MQEFFSLKFGPNKKKFFSLDPVIQADTRIKHCYNFSRDSLAFESEICVSSA